jgi:predicted ferric reductase
MKKIFFILFFFINLGVIFCFWALQSGDLLFLGSAEAFISLGRITGLLAVYLVLWQLVLIGRIKFLEQVFGLDRLAVIHHFNGLLAWIFIFLHPIFLIIGYGRSLGQSFISQTIDFLFRGDDLTPAFLAVAAFAVVIVTSIETMRKRIKYEAWYLVHLLTYLAIIWAFGHQLELGNDLRNIVFAVYWRLLYITAIGLLIYFRFFRPAKIFYRHRFHVDRVVRENETVVSVYIKGRDLQNFVFRPGQFAIFRFLDKGLWWQAHPFSFSLPPNGEYLRITIKNLGDFTATIAARLRPGTLVLIDGPHGIFTAGRTTNNRLALLAGGIGLTPLAAIFTSPEARDLVLFYAEQNETKLVFREELEKVRGANRRIHYIFSQSGQNAVAPSLSGGETGRLDEEKIKRLLPDYLERDFFLCGPPLMIKALRRTLRRLDVPRRQIYFEKFSLN